MDARLKTPFNCIISGASKTGKTTLVNNLLTVKNTIFSTKPDYILLIYKYNQDIYSQMKENKLVDELISMDNTNITFESLVEKVSLYKEKNGSLIIFDDSMTEVGSKFEQIFTNLSHHQNCSIIFLTQNLFYNNTTYRTMSLNTNYFFLMRNERDKQQITTLAKQFRPGNTAMVVQSYLDATQYPYSYLMLDFSPQTCSILTLRAKIFPSEFPYTIYLEK
jgi:predicted ATPase